MAWWVRTGGLAAAVGTGGYGIEHAVIPAIPPGGSRDTLRQLLVEGVSYTPSVSAGLGGLSVLGGLWWWRSTRAQRHEKTLEQRRKHPTAADRAAAIAVKLPVGAVQVRVRYRARTRFRRRVRRVLVDAPPGALAEDPSRSWAQALAPILDETLTTDTWDITRGRARLRPGVLPAADGALPPTATTPVERGEQAIRSLLGAAAEHVERDIVATHDDGTPKAFSLRHAPAGRIASPQRREQVSELVSEMMPTARGGRGWRVTVEPDADRIHLREHKPIPSRILRPLFDQQAMFGGQLLLPVGQDEDEHYLGFDGAPATNQPHGLIVGPTGTGKTSLIRSIIVAASHYGWEMWGVDPKRIELLGITDWPGFTTLAVDVDAIRALIHAAHAEMFARYERIENREIRRENLPPLLVILDEYLIMRSQLMFAHRAAGLKGQPPEFEMLADMLALARSARVHLLIGVQRPDAELFLKGARDNLRWRASLGQLSSEGAGMVWEHPRIGTTPTGINGRGMATGRDGHPVTMQAWWTPSLDSHPHAREAMSQAERDRVDALRPAAYGTTTSWSTTTSGLAIPATATADERTHIPAGSAADATADVVDVLRARNLTAGMEIRLDDDSGDLADATIDEVEQETHGGPVRVDLTWDNGSAEQIELEDGREVWVLKDLATAT